MFGIPSIQKLIVLAAVIALVWYGFKFVGRLQDQRKANGGLGARAARRRKTRGRSSSAEPAVQDAEDMVACPVCQAYVQARGATRCDRSDCPY
jgi:uncharacterized protein